MVLAVTALVALAAALFLVRKESSTEQTGVEGKGMAPQSGPSRAAKAEAGGREHCRQKCAALDKGFIYRSRRNAEAEYCGCV